MKRFSLPQTFSRRTYVTFFVVAVMCGAVIKSLVNDVVTIGYEDYTLKNSSRSLDLNLLQEEMIQKSKTAVLAKAETPRGETCSQ